MKLLDKLALKTKSTTHTVQSVGFKPSHTESVEENPNLQIFDVRGSAILVQNRGMYEYIKARIPIFLVEMNVYPAAVNRDQLKLEKFSYPESMPRTRVRQFTFSDMVYDQSSSTIKSLFDCNTMPHKQIDRVDISSKLQSENFS